MSQPNNKTAKHGENFPDDTVDQPLKMDGPTPTVVGRRLVLVVTGGVAAYKAAELARMWVRAGARVRVAMTEAATRFVTPMTFEALTGQPVAWDMWARPQFEIEHIAWADWAEALVAAPASADFLAKMAHGLADDFASSLVLAFRGPKIVAPAMNTGMYENPATQDNLGLLARRGVEIAWPGDGLLACGTVGAGRLAGLDRIALMASRALAPKDFAGLRLAVSAGSTREAWDDIRYLANRSSGLMGLSLALAAWLRGAEVTLTAGPGLEALSAWSPDFSSLPGFNVQRIESTRELLAAVERLDFQVLIMAAAPADFRPAERAPGKIKKGGGPPVLALAANPDILKSLDKGRRVFVGFAAEDRDLVARARVKLAEKNLDLVVANQAGGPDSAFAAEENHLWLVRGPEAAREVSPRPKFAAAWAILDEVAGLPAFRALVEQRENQAEGRR